MKRESRKLEQVRQELLVLVLAAALCFAIFLPTDNVAAASCAPVVTRLASGFSQPDDLAWIDGSVAFSDVGSDEIGRIVGHRSVVWFRNLDVPEGMVPWGQHQMLVVQQGVNQITQIDLKTGQRRYFTAFRNRKGREGIDDIAVIDGDLIVPDSSFGMVLRLRKRHWGVIARHLARPVAAVDYDGGIAIADEHGNAISYVKHGRISTLATGVSYPDDVVTISGMLLAVTLGDGGLWEIKPHFRRLATGFNQPQGLLTTGSHGVDVASSGQNEIFHVTIQEACAR